METLDSLREERDEARNKCVGILVADICDAYYCQDIQRVITTSALLSLCPYPRAREMAIGMAVGNFLVFCAHAGDGFGLAVAGNGKVEVIPGPKASADAAGEVLFEAKG